MFLRYALHKRQGQLPELHVFVLHLNSINVGKYLISYGIIPMTDLPGM